MTLRHRTTKGKTVFEFEENGMTASWTLTDQDTGAAIVGKLDRMLAFLRREKLGDMPSSEPSLSHQAALGYTAPAGRARVLPQAELDEHLPQFTGVPPIQAPSLEASIAQATSSGWELYTEGEDD